MSRALVIGASGGIGAALADALEAGGDDVVRLSRSADGLDVTDGDSVARVLGEVEGPFDLILLATGILAPEGAEPEKALARIDGPTMAQVMAVNAIGPALVLAQVPRLLDRDGAGKVGVITARVGSIGDNRLGGWHSYRASKAAANMIVRGAAVELGRTHNRVTCVALHPGTVATRFTADYPGHRKVGPDEAAANLIAVMDRLEPEQTGGFFDYAGEPIPW
ncbi:SDR family NAD(P)-dependent oxidoreductase [Wenxinia marina]|uniref:Short-chain dehydrogenase n=1 Tax=Wenxinia marina DSM 24838 TaxID=1123501 RepID=A0A0D0QDP1_9RHOB|nr:SDR family NAD(P)-dependent oxidoreductase [Wenxinia marina]KIQ70462.1 Short-chain dehydrogenase [Wenxinia marina DSM 24838]GGL52948.1 SDR family oxidoreductase [Wenxinia marina]